MKKQIKILFDITRFSFLKYFVISALMLSSSSVVAASNKLASLFELSLEELLAIKVTTASKFEESIHDAHASISIVTKEQIAIFGGTYLHEILERIVNVNSVFGVLTSISTRGSKPWSSLVHHLVLINGRPTGNVAGDYNLYSSVPLSSIERIEYIRGPGSVLYGTNAYYGVFNIITKKATEEGWQAQQKLSIGSFGQQTLDGNYLYQQGNLNIAMSMLYSDEDGWDAKTFDPLEMRVFSRKAFHREKTLHLDIQFEDFSFSHYNSHQEQFGNFWDAPEANYIPWFKDHPINITNIGYIHHFNNEWRLETNFTRIDKKVEWNTNGVADSFLILVADIDIKLLELNLFAQLSSDSTFLAGITRENRVISNSFTVPYGDEDYASFYMQYQQQLNDWWSYMIGAQYVTSIKLKDNVNNKSDIVPRAGVIFDVNDKLAFKFLYGEAYRQAQIHERYLDSPGIEIGNPNLNSENIKTLETQLFYQDHNSLITLTYYNSKEDELIGLSHSDDPVYPLEYNNIGTLSSHGLELEYKYQPDDHWMLEFAWSKQESKDQDNNTETTLMPTTSWKLGVAYLYNDWQLGLYNLNYSQFKDSIAIIPNREEINPKAKGFNWTTFKASTILYQKKNGQSLEFSFEIKNIFDEEVYVAQDVPTFYPINTVPSRAGRSTQFSLTYRL